jgi:hypothetical protein
VTNIQIGGLPYKVVESWSEMTIQQAVELYEICEDIPDKLNDLYRALSNKEELQKAMLKVSEKESIKTFPAFYGKILEHLSDIPGDVINKIPWNDRTAFYNKYLEQYIIGLLYHPIDFQAKGIESFEYEGEEYFLPATKVVINDERLFADETAITFAESADLELNSRSMAGGKYTVAPNIISILCRPKGEVYDEAKSLERAERFKELTMDVFWEVFFCLEERLRNLRNGTLTFLAGSGSKARRSRRSQELKPLDGMVQ